MNTIESEVSESTVYIVGAGKDVKSGGGVRSTGRPTKEIDDDGVC